jgi:hypothetical protein
MIADQKIYDGFVQIAIGNFLLLEEEIININNTFGRKRHATGVCG